MIGEPLTIVNGAKTHNCVRTSLSGRRGTFEAAASDGTETIKVQVDHTIPSSPTGTTQHMIRADVNIYDATSGDYKGTESIWMVIKTTGKAQSASRLQDLFKGVMEAVAGGAFATPTYNLLTDLTGGEP